MAKRARKKSRLHHVAKLHGRLITSTLIGLVATFVLMAVTDWRAMTAALIGWDLGVLVYLVTAIVTITRFDLAKVKQRASEEDEGATLILILTVIAAAASLAALIGELGSMGSDASKALFFSHAVLTIVLSWTFIQVIFTFHYAHEYYGEGRDRRRGGLTFPDDPTPDYWDFVYFSFVIGMTFQVSDVQVTSKFIRRLVVAHGLVSFVFNVAILAVTVNIGGNLFGQS